MKDCGRILWSCLFLAILSHRAAGQAPHLAWRPTVGATLGGSFPTHAPFSSPGVVGIGVGVDVRLPFLDFRPTIQLMRSVSSADDLSICLPVAPAGNCFEPSYARTYVTGVVDGLIGEKLLHFGYVLVGTGQIALRGALYPTSQPLPRSRTVVRLGVGGRLGRSARAPRLEAVTTEFMHTAGSAKRLLSVGVWVR